MLKKYTFRKIALATLLLLLAFLLYNFPDELKEDVSIKRDKSINIYLIDEDDFIAMSEISSNANSIDEQIETILYSLIIDSNYSSNLPNGFKAIIPKDTKILDYSLDNGLFKVNFSKEFLNITEDKEEKMIEAIIFSLTTIKDIKKIMIFVDGVKLNELPNSHKKLDLYLDRSYGINKVYDISTFYDTKMVTIYYLNKKDNYYYVPISYVINSDDTKVEIIINNLKSNRLNSSTLLSHLDYQVELMNYEENENSLVLNFNDILLNSIYNGKLKEEVKYAISYSIYDTLGISDVVFQVNGNVIDEFRLEN